MRVRWMSIGREIRLLADRLLYVSLHKKIVVISHFYLLFVKRIFICDEFLGSRQIFPFCPTGVAGICEHIYMAVLSLGETDVEPADFGRLHGIETRRDELVSVLVILEDPDILYGLFGGFFRICGRFPAFGSGGYILYERASDRAGAFGMQPQRDVESLGAVSLHHPGVVAVVGKDIVGAGGGKERERDAKEYVKE